MHIVKVYKKLEIRSFLFMLLGSDNRCDRINHIISVIIVNLRIGPIAFLNRTKIASLYTSYPELSSIMTSSKSVGTPNARWIGFMWSPISLVTPSGISTAIACQPLNLTHGRKSQAHLGDRKWKERTNEEDLDLLVEMPIKKMIPPMHMWNYYLTWIRWIILPTIQTAAGF